MLYKLFSGLTEVLLTKPETGMGYQVVELSDESERKYRGIAYNAELFSLKPLAEKALFSEGYDSLLKRAEPWPGKQAWKVKVIDRATLLREALYRNFADSLEIRNTTKGAADAPDEQTKRGEFFKRFSAYRNDRRITPGRGLVPGTYATTEEDARNVRTGKEAVARYALPNPKPAVNVFTIAPEEQTRIRKGIAQPAFGQPGGGVEVLFMDGSSDNTVTGPDLIPEG